jgi:hypothetical protein
LVNKERKFNMHTRWLLLIGILISGLHHPLRGEIIFSQDFSSSSDVNSYINPTAPSSGQWNAISGGTVQRYLISDWYDNKLTFSRGSSTESFTRSSDFAPVPGALIYTFELGVQGPTTKTTAAATFQVGSGFTPQNGVEANSAVFSQFAINFTGANGGYTFRNLDGKSDYTAQTFGGRGPVTWVINHSGSTLQYTAPNGTTQSVGNNQWDLWFFSYPIFDNVAATTPGQPLTDLKFAFSNGTGTLTLDNLSIDNMQAVPEPSASGTLAAAFCGVVAASTAWVRTRQRKVRQRVAFLRTWSTH